MNNNPTTDKPVGRCVRVVSNPARSGEEKTRSSQCSECGGDFVEVCVYVAVI